MNTRNQRFIAVMLCCVVLSGCQAQTENSTETAVNTVSVSSTKVQTSSDATMSAEEKITYSLEATPTAVQPENQVTQDGQTLGLEGVSNARQLGGYVTEDGKTVKENVLLRSGKLASATEDDLKKLTEDYNLTEVIDLRTTVEIEAAPDPEIDGVENIQIKVLDEDSSAASAAVSVYNTDSDNPAASLLAMYQNGILSDDMYISMFESEVSLAGYRSFIDELLTHEGGAILWHCTGGKDRAGTATVILLTLLGVDKETILKDFELTNDFNSQSIAYMKQCAAELTDDQDEIDGVGYLVGVSVPIMENLYEYAESESGSMLQFIKDKLNVTDEEINTLRSKYLK